MKNKFVIIGAMLLASSVYADDSSFDLNRDSALPNNNASEELDSYKNESIKDYRVNPFPNNPLVNSGGGEASRYNTNQGWSRGSYGSWWGYYGGRSDIATTGYTRPSRSR